MSEGMKAARLPAAAVSPRISGGTLKWYEGDTFTLYLRTDMTDTDGEAVHLQRNDRLTVTFFDRCLRQVYRFCMTAVQEDTVALVFDAEVSSRFPKGEYTYDIYLESDRRVTLAKGNPVAVE